jgi:hypothetical protein
VFKILWNNSHIMIRIAFQRVSSNIFFQSHTCSLTWNYIRQKTGSVSCRKSVRFHDWQWRHFGHLSLRCYQSHANISSFELVLCLRASACHGFGTMISLQDLRGTTQNHQTTSWLWIMMTFSPFFNDMINPDWIFESNLSPLDSLR